MNSQIKELLKPEILNSINGLELIARIVVEGFMSGGNKSLTIGTGHEFSQYRNYEPGDDIRQLDWKMYARSERYFVRQSEIETNITVRLLIDASCSMSYTEDKISKLAYAKVMAAALGYLARRQGDAFGLAAVNDKGIQIIQPRYEQRHFLRYLHALTEIKSEGTWTSGNRTEQLLDHSGKEMIIFITDLYDDDQDLFKFIARLKTIRNEVIVFHLMGRHELEMDFEGSFTFRDLETDVTKRVNTLEQRDRYTQKMNEWLNHSRMWMYERRISYHQVRLQDPFENSLRDFLKVRKTLAR